MERLSCKIVFITPVVVFLKKLVYKYNTHIYACDRFFLIMRTMIIIVVVKIRTDSYSINSLKIECFSKFLSDKKSNVS